MHSKGIQSALQHPLVSRCLRYDTKSKKFTEARIRIIRGLCLMIGPCFPASFVDVKFAAKPVEFASGDLEGCSYWRHPAELCG